MSTQPPTHLRAVLTNYNAQILKEMLRFMKEDPKTYKNDNIALLVKRLPDKRRIRYQVTQTSELEKATIARILFMGNNIQSKRLKNQLLQNDLIKETPEGRASRYSYEPNPTYSGTPAFEDLLAGLVRRGLVFSHKLAEEGKSMIGWGPGRYIFIPKMILKHIDQHVLPEVAHNTMFEPSFVRSGSVVNVQRDINNYMHFAQQVTVVKLTAQGQLYKTALREVAGFSSQPTDIGSGKKETDNAYLFFLRRILNEGDLLERTRGGLVAADSKHMFWKLDSAERIEFIYTQWRDSTAWNGLRFLSSYDHGNDIKAPAPRGLIDARKTVLEQIGQLGTEWVSFPALIDNIQNKSYGFMFAKRAYHARTHYYYEYDTRGGGATPYAYSNNPFGMGFQNIKDEADGWNKVEAAYINHLIAGPLYWLGLVDIGYRGAPPENDLLSIKRIGGYRLTEYGAWLIGGQAQPVVDTQDQRGGLILQPNFEILAMQPISVDVLMTLDSFAQVKDNQQHVTTYELTRESVYRGQQGAWQVPAILEFFNTHSKMPVPDNVRRTLEEWDTLHTRITIRRHVRLGESVEAGITDQLTQELDKTRKVTENVFLSELTFTQLSNGVRKAGYLPLQTRRNDMNATNSIQIEDDGRIRFVHRVPTIFAAQALAEISTEVDSTHEPGVHRRLIPAMLRDYTNDGAHFNELFGQLKRLNKGAISKQLEINLKAWSHYYGDALQAQLILIEFRDKKARDELCREADLRDYLKPFVGQRALAVVQPEHVELVNAQLKLRGINIADGL